MASARGRLVVIENWLVLVTRGFTTFTVGINS